MRNRRLWIVPVLVAGLAGCGTMVRPADTTPMPGEDRLPDGPGLFATSPHDSAREGYVINSSGRCKEGCVKSDVDQSDEYKRFEAFKRMDHDSPEYREFQDWLEWKQYQQYRKQKSRQ